MTVKSQTSNVFSVNLIGSVYPLTKLPFGCREPGSLLQKFQLTTEYELKLWNNCVPWNDVVGRQHDNWCVDDCGANWYHTLQGGQYGCAFGFGKAFCAFPPKLRYTWDCLTYSVTGRYEQRTCAERFTANAYWDRVWYLDWHEVMCDSDELLTYVEWVTSYYVDNGASGRGYYKYTCCKY